MVADTTSGRLMAFAEGDPRTGPPPDHLIQALQRYRDDRTPTGGFLRAVLENDLVVAVVRADLQNIHQIAALVTWCNWHLPYRIWGSKEAVHEHLGG